MCASAAASAIAAMRVAAGSGGHGHPRATSQQRRRCSLLRTRWLAKAPWSGKNASSCGDGGKAEGHPEQEAGQGQIEQGRDVDAALQAEARQHEEP